MRTWAICLTNYVILRVCLTSRRLWHRVKSTLLKLDKMRPKRKRREICNNLEMIRLTKFKLTNLKKEKVLRKSSSIRWRN